MPSVKRLSVIRRRSLPMTVATACTILIAAGIPFSTRATVTFCAVVAPTPDGFLALREGPGTSFRIIVQLKPYDLLLVDTGSCRNGLCDETGRWLFVVEVPRIDGPTSEVKSFTQGWVRARYIRQIVCPE